MNSSLGYIALEYLFLVFFSFFLSFLFFVFLAGWGCLCVCIVMGAWLGFLSFELNLFSAVRVIVCDLDIWKGSSLRIATSWGSPLRLWIVTSWGLA